MKKTNLLIFSLSTALMLTACNTNKKNKSSNSEPVDEGTVVDVTNADGKAAFKERAEKVIAGYDQEFSAYGFETKVRDVSLQAAGTVKVEIDDEEGEPTGEYLNNSFDVSLGASLDLGAGIAKAEDDIIGHAYVSDLSLDATAKGHAELSEEMKFDFDEKLNASGVGADAYLTNDNIYIDYSSGANRTAINSASNIVNDILTLMGIGEYAKMDLNQMLDDTTGAPGRKIAFEDVVEIPDEIFTPIKSMRDEGVDFTITGEALDEVANFFRQYTFLEFVTFKDGRFGLRANITKQDLGMFVTLFVADAETAQQVTAVINQIVSKFSINAGVYFTKDGLLNNTELSFDVAAMLPEMQVGDGTYLSLSKAALSGSVTTDVLYNSDVKFNLPSAEELATYVVLNKVEEDA